MKIKVCGLKYPSNMNELINLPIDFVGFIFYKNSPRYINDEISFDFIRTIPSHIKKVGVFVNSDSYSIINSIAHYNLDFVQLHGDESVVFCDEIKPYVKVIKAFQIHDLFDFSILEDFEPYVDYFLFDTASKDYGGSGQSFSWQLLEKYTLNTPFFLSGGISEFSIDELLKINHKQLYAIDLNSKFEIVVGLKDANKIKSFITKLKQHEHTKYI